MDPLTLLLGGGLAWLLFGRRSSSLPMPAAPAASSSSSSFLSPPGVTSPIQYTGPLPGARGVEDVSASPLEQSGYIPPYIATPTSSAVALDLGPGPRAAGLYGLACGCGDRSGSGLGNAQSDLVALRGQLHALRASFRAQIRAAVQAKQWGQVQTLVDELHDRIRELVTTFQTAHPDAYPPRVIPSVAPNFMLERRGPRDVPFPWLRGRL